MGRRLVEGIFADRVVERIVEQARAELGATGAALALLVDDGPEAELELVASTSYFAPPWAAGLRRFPLGTALPLADAVRTGRPVLLTSAAERARRYPEQAPLGVYCPIGPLAALPLVARRGVIGGLALGFPGWRSVGLGELQSMLAIADWAAEVLVAVGPWPDAAST